MSEPILSPEAFAELLDVRPDGVHHRYGHWVSAIRERDAMIRRAALEKAAKLAIEFMQENHELRISIQRTDDLADAIRSA